MIKGVIIITRLPCTFLLVLAFATVHVHAIGLPDTGQDICYDDAVADGVTASNPASIARDAGSHPRQDCRYGRDAAAAAGTLTKTGAGAKGFDYTKIANNGSTLAAGATLGIAASSWACTKDNITGLTWEVKTDTRTDLRYSGHTYTWFNSDGSTNGGDAGNAGGNGCNATLPSNLCNTQAFVAAVNTTALCSYTDWRLPTLRELRTLIDTGRSSPSIDRSYFPDAPAASLFWSGTSSVPFPPDAWFVSFIDGVTSAYRKSANSFVRLVRGGQF